MESQRTDRIGKVSLYLRIASILRTRILHGEWLPGDCLPSLPTLVREFAVAPGTVRQAIHLLAREGLLSSWQGRGTFVTIEAQRSVKPRINQEIEKHLELPAGHSIQVLSRQTVSVLPRDRLAKGRPLATYSRIEKVHLENGQPYCQSTVCVDPAVYQRFPAGADESHKIIKLLHDLGEVRIQEIDERISVGQADLRVAQLLDCSMADPVARVQHSILNPQGRIVLYADALHRGDRFVIDRNITDLIDSD